MRLPTQICVLVVFFVALLCDMRGMQPPPTPLLLLLWLGITAPTLPVISAGGRLHARIASPAPCVTYSGSYKGLSVTVVWAGHDTQHDVDLIGTGPATLATYLACQALNPDLVISTGTAGGFRARVWRQLGAWRAHWWRVMHAAVVPVLSACDNVRM